MSDSGEINEVIAAMKAEMASLKNSVRAHMTNEVSGLDFVEFGTDDDCMPNVPIAGGGMENFDLKTKEDESVVIGEGVVCVGRKYYKKEETAIDGDGEYRIKVTLSINGPTITIEKGNGFEDPNEEVSYIPLYVVSDKKIKTDYRCNFCVVARE